MLSIAVVITASLLLAYLFLIFTFQKGWKRIPSPDSTPTNTNRCRISVVICCKNEAHHLPHLIAALKNQRFKHFELVWVNDHSDDATQQIMESSLPFFEQVQIINPQAKGKKQALKAGVLSSTGNLIITTDADCVPGENWLATIAAFQDKESADLIIAPVKLSDGNKLFTRLQQLEFATLVGSGIGAAGANMPILCNAANMAFTKQAWIDSIMDLHKEEVSGDDIFLLLSIKKRKGKIAVLKSHEAMVVTQAMKSLNSFIAQRRRWASKSSKYSDLHLFSTGIVIAGINLLMVFLLVLALFSPLVWYVLMSVFVIKLAADYSFLKLIQPFFLFKLNGLNVLLLSLLYPLYVIVVGLSSVVWKKKDW